MAKKETEEVDLDAAPAAAEPKKPRKPRTKAAEFSRKEYTHCIFIGKGKSAKFWAKSEAEAKEIVMTKIPPSKRDNVQVGVLKTVEIKVDVVM
jgi:hypothetical protein